MKKHPVCYLLLSFTEFTTARIVDAEEGHDTVDDLPIQTVIRLCQNYHRSYKKPKVFIFGKPLGAFVDELHLWGRVIQS